MRIKTVISFAIALWLIGTIIAGVGLYGSYVKVDGALQANRTAEEVARSVIDLNVLTGEFLLHPQSRSRIQWQGKYEVLGRHLSHPNLRSPEEVRDLSIIHEGYLTSGKVFQKLAERIIRESKSAKSDDPHTLVHAQEGLVTQLTVTSRAMISAAYQLGNRSRLALNQALAEAAVIVAVLIALVAVLILSFAIYLRGRISRPIDHLRKGLQTLGGGDLSHRIGSVGKDEIGMIAGAIDTMAERLGQAAEALKQQSRSSDLLRKIAIAANDIADTDQAMKVCLDEVCAYTGWPIGHVYELSRDGSGELRPTKLWHLDDPKRFEAFRRATETTSFAPGTGLPGRVLSSGKPSWTVDVTDGTNFLRARVAGDVGVKAGMAFPVLIGKEVWAVLEFFSENASEPDQHILEIMAQVGTQFGRAIERRRAERALQDSQRRLTDAIESISEGFILYDADETLILCNSRYRELFPEIADLMVPGVCLEDLLQAAAERGQVAEAARNFEDWTHKRLHQYRTGEGVVEQQLSDGRWVLASERRTQEGGIVGIRTDITERKQVEESLKSSERAAYERVIELEQAQILLEAQGADLIRVAGDLTVARDESEAANRAKSQFLAAMSHELRTPLNAIIGFSELIKGETFGPVGSPKYLEYVGDIHSSGQHLLGLINDILDLSKIESGEDELFEEAVDVGPLVQSAIRLIQHRSDKGNVELGVDLQEGLPTLWADRRKLTQILVNLLSNAVKFTEPGGRVTLKARCREDSGFVFYVIDTGIGMAPSEIPKALSQFTQVNSNLNRKFEGTGLGLPLTKALIELHGGSLDLQSELGVGTTVILQLPASRLIEAERGASSMVEEDRIAG